MKYQQLTEGQRYQIALLYEDHFTLTERGVNENTNGLLRQFIPKGTDLRTVSEEDLMHYQNALNSRPRKCLGSRQPSVVFAELRQAA